MTDRHTHEPDPVVLDELSRAFGGAAGPTPDEPGADEPGADGAGAAGPTPDAAGADAAGAHGPGADGAGTPPTIIRIGDDSTSVEVGRVAHDPVGEPTPPAPVRSPVAAPTDDVVVIGGDDELPDAVYIDGSLDRDGSRTIVFIEDDDTGDTLAVDASRDSRRGIEPRLRERRVAVKRAQSRKRLKWVALVVVVVAVVVAALALLGSPLFAVRADRITVTGNVYADAERLGEVIDDLAGTPSLRVDTQRLERELAAIPWVDRARVRVEFPHAATVDIRERAAMTTYQGPDGRFRVLDREGRVLDVIDQYPFAYVLLTGPDPVDLDPGEFAPTGYAAASELAKNLTPSIRGRVEHVEVTSDGSRLVIHLADGSAVFFGEARDFSAKLLRLESVLAANPEREPGPIDVSTDDVTS